MARPDPSSIKVYWQVDVAADPRRSEHRLRSSLPAVFRDVRADGANRYDYYAQIAQAASQTAFDGLFIGYRPESDDSSIVAAALAREAPRLTLIPEFPAWVGSAVYAAKQAVSFQRATHERLAWAIAPPADAAVRARDGDHVPTQQLHARTEEFLQVARGVHGERPFDHAGEHFEVQGGGFEAPLNGVAFPRVFLQGDTGDALALSARAADVHLFAAAPVSVLRGLIEELGALAREEGRTVAFGIIQPVLAREFMEEARQDAERAGLPASAIVGDYAGVAARLAELAEVGLTHFVLTGPSSSLEEAYAVGQQVLPRFRALAESEVFA